MYNNQGKKWTTEDIEFLKKEYGSRDLNRIALENALERPWKSIKTKAHHLGLTLYQEVLEDGFKRCSKCDIVYPLELFNKNASKKGGYHNWCKFCVAQQHQIRVKRSLIKICSKCNQEKSVLDFHTDKKSKDGLTYYCKDCVITHNKKYRGTGGY